MVRPRQFDEDAALTAAMDCFWQDGFGATSIRDLSARTGLTLASLYNAFGDKRQLFAKVLNLYIDRNIIGHLSTFETRYPPREAIMEFLDDVVERSLSDRDHRGCLLVNSALDVAPHDGELGAAVARGLRVLEDFFRRTVAEGQRGETISSSQPADDLARLLLGTLLALRVLARSRPERELLAGILRSVAVTLGAVSSRPYRR